MVPHPLRVSGYGSVGIDGVHTRVAALGYNVDSVGVPDAPIDSLMAGVAQHNGARFSSAGDWITRYGLASKMADGVHLNTGGCEVLTMVRAGKLADLNFVALWSWEFKVVLRP